MKNRKHYYENDVKSNVTSFNLPKEYPSFKVPIEAVEIRARFTQAQIQYLKFKYFWIGFASGSAILTLAYLYMNLYLKLAI